MNPPSTIPLVPPARTGRPARCALLLVLAACLLPACRTVEPWERGEFATYEMRPDRDPLHVAMSEHIHFSREATSGGRAVGGSGCGCN
jgi:hypothetical protein